MQRLAEDFGRTHAAVRARAVRLGLTSPRPAAAPPAPEVEYDCLRCGAPFLRSRSGRLAYCSADCAHAACDDKRRARSDCYRRMQTAAFGNHA